MGGGRTAASRGQAVGVAAPVVRAALELAAAIRLLTRFRIGSPAGDAMASGASAFPLVGALIAAPAAVPLVVAGSSQPVIAGLLAVAVVAVLTGALHLDGLADTADALVAPSPEIAERARTDPAIGPGGATTLILVLGIETFALAGIASSGGGWLAGAGLVVASAVGRTVPLAVIAIERSRVSADGFGAWFAARVRPPAVAVACVLAGLLTGAAALLTGSPGVAVGGLAGALAGVVAGVAIVRARHQLDGDGMGAIVETTVAATLTAIAFAA